MTGSSNRRNRPGRLVPGSLVAVIASLFLGRFCKVHPLLLIIATLLGASLFGLIGVFLAAPVTALARQTFLFVVERVQGQEMTPSLRTA